jgi:hypothetical protein
MVTPMMSFCESINSEITPDRMREEKREGVDAGYHVVENRNID